MIESWSDWAAEQEFALQRIILAAGKSGLAEKELLSGKNGLEILEAMMAGKIPYPPMNDTMNMVLLEADVGRATFQGIPLLKHYNPLGTVHGGWFVTLMDSALGCAVQTTLQEGRSYTPPNLA